MHSKMKLLASAIFSFLGCHYLTLASPIADPAIFVRGIKEISARSAKTCADPSLAQTFYQGFNGPNTIHFLETWIDLANFNTFTASAFWVDLRPTFHAWKDQQPFTVPLFALVNSGATEYIFLTGADEQSPPIVSGFSNAGLIAWVYDTPVCGSVPLESAVNAAATDHFYTTDTDEHTRLVSIPGWADTGVVAYVLPVTPP